MDPELARRNLRFGWALFVLFWLLFAGTIIVASVPAAGLYLADRIPQRMPVAQILKASAAAASIWSLRRCQRPTRRSSDARVGA